MSWIWAMPRCCWKIPAHLGEAARELLKRGIMPTEDGWGGWLGKYQAALCRTVHEIEKGEERDLIRAR